MLIADFCVVTSCVPISGTAVSERQDVSIFMAFYLEGGGNKLLRKVGIHLLCKPHDFIAQKTTNNRIPLTLKCCEVARKLPCCGPGFAFPAVELPLLDALPVCCSPHAKPLRITSYCSSSHRTQLDRVTVCVKRDAIMISSRGRVVLIPGTVVGR
jgi:hypothetical protein